MTTPANPVKPITATIRGTAIARTFTPGSIVIPDGTRITGLSRYVRNAIDDLLTILLNGQTFCEGIWEIQITMRQKDSLGVSESIQKPNKKK